MFLVTEETLDEVAECADQSISTTDHGQKFRLPYFRLPNI